MGIICFSACNYRHGMNRRGSEPSLAASRCDAAYFDFNFAYPSPPLLLVPPFCAAFPFTIIICFDESGLVCEGGGGSLAGAPVPHMPHFVLSCYNH